MSANLCQHTHADGAGCQAPAQTGKSHCFFHDPAQERRRARAQRNGGYMRGRYIDSETDSSPLAALNLAPIEVNKVDDVIPVIVEHVNLYRQGKITKDEAKVMFWGCSALVGAFREKRQAEHEARLVAEIASEAQEKAAKVRASALVEAPDFSPPRPAVGRVEGAPSDGPLGPAAAPEDDVIIIDASKPLDLSQFGGKMPKFTSSQLEMTDIVTGDIHIVTSRGTTIIPGNKNKPDQKPESDAAPLGTTAPFSTVRQTPSALAAPVEASGSVGAPDFSPPRPAVGRVESVQSDAALACPGVPRAAGKSRDSGTTEEVVYGFRLPRRAVGSRNLMGTPTDQSRSSGTTERLVGHGFSPDGTRLAGETEPFQRREGIETKDQLRSAEGMRVAERSATEERPDAAKDEKPAPKDDEPKKDPNNPYSITTRQGPEPRPSESRPRDPSVHSPKTPLRLQGRRIPPGCKLHPWIEYWGLH